MSKFRHRVPRAFIHYALRFNFQCRSQISKICHLQHHCACAAASDFAHSLPICIPAATIIAYRVLPRSKCPRSWPQTWTSAQLATRPCEALTVLGERDNSSKIVIRPANLIPSSDGSASQSWPFLDLPPELRNRIYELVLGGNLIHIRIIAGAKSFQVTVCDGDPEVTQDVVASSAHCRIIRTPCRSEPLVQRHLACWSRSKIGLSPAVLQIRRQTYSEAALITFTSNAFSFAQRPAFKAFLAILSRVQLRAITSLQFERSGYDTGTMRTSRALYLSGIRHLKITLISRWKNAASVGKSPVEVFFEEHEGAFHHSEWASHRPLRLGKVEVVMDIYTHHKTCPKAGILEKAEEWRESVMPRFLP